jgi:hypothetical protein
MLKGKVTLRIADAKTGKIVHEESHTNTVTPALAKIIAGNIAGQMNYKKITPLYTKLLGGVCLFDGSVSASDVFLPKADDATLTAHAGQHGFDTNSDTKRGTPNTQESLVFANGVTWVWNWLQTNGNGRITDVVLTHSDTGDYWNEQDNNNTMASDFCPVDYVGNNTIVPDEFYNSELGVIPYQKKIPIGFYNDTDHVVSIEFIQRGTRVDTAGNTVQAGGVNVYVSKFTGTGVFLWNELGEPFAESSFYVELPWYQFGNFEERYIPYHFAYDDANKKLYFIAIGKDNLGWDDRYDPYDNRLRLTTIDIEEQTSTYTEIDLSSLLSGATFYAANSYLPIELQIIDNCIFLPLYNSTYCAKVNMLTHTATLVNNFYEDTTVENTRGNNFQIDLGKGRLMNSDAMVYINDSGAYKGIDIKYDSNIFDKYAMQRFFVAKQATDNPVQFITCGGSLANVNKHERGCLLNKLYAATVFHLETSVVKNSSQTMTVEYTLTHEEEQS